MDKGQDGWPLMDYQKKSCPLCCANLPHAKHATALELGQMGMRITEDLSVVFEGTHGIVRRVEEAA